MTKELDKQYIIAVHDLSERIRSARISAIRKANNSMMELYFNIGEYICSKN